jgi:hypothetical protein
MGITVDWDNTAKTIVRYEFDEQWKWEEFYVAKKHAYTIINTVPHKVGVIMNAPPNVQLPPNMLTHSLSALRNKHPNTVILVFVLTQPFMRAMISTMGKISRMASSSIELATTLDEARAIVDKRLYALHDDDVTQPYR